MRMKKAVFWLVMAVILAAAPALAKPERHKLPSGLTIITEENHEAPVVSFQVWVRAGAAFERTHEYGITHLIEHMIFKGSPKDPKGEMAGKIEALGGQVNAYTTLDHTNYHATAASRFAPQVLELLADAVVNANFDEGELAREKEVVIEEIRMNQDDPARRRFKKALAASFGDHPYGRPVLGTVDSVKAISRQDILEYRKRWYRAPNVVVVAVGDFKTRTILPLLEKAFKNLPQGPSPDFKLPPVTLPQGPRLELMKEKVRQASVILTWRIPGMPSPKVFPLDVTASVLGEGETSRLYAKVKEKLGLVDGVSSFAYTLRGQGVFMIIASMSPDKVDQALPALLKETYSLLKRPPSGEELKIANVNLSASFVRDRQTMDGQANTLGYFEMFWGGYEKAATYLEKFKDVAPENVDLVVRDYFDADGLMVLVQSPVIKGLPDKARLSEMVKKARQEAIKAEDLPDKVEKFTLKNGLTLVVQPRRAIPLVSFDLATFGGQALDTKKTAGLYQLWSRTLTRGTENHTYWELTRELESMAGSLSAFSGKSTCGVSGSFLSADWARGLGLLAEVWQRPIFPEKELNKAKAEQRAALRAQLDSPPGRTFMAFRKLFYGDHPYGLNRLGTQETLAGFTSADLKKAHERVNGLDGAVLTVVGDVDPSEVLARVRRLLGGKTKKAPQLNLASPKPHNKPAHEELADPKAKQTQIVVGFAAPSATDPKRHEAALLQAILGGMGGRLFRDLRDIQSLAYTVQPFYSDSLKAGVFGVYMAVGAGKEEQAMAGLHKKLVEIAQNPPTDQEVKRAKAYILGARDIGLQTNMALAGTMAIDELLGLGFDYYKKMPRELMAINAKDISDAARKILDFNQLVKVTMGRNSQK
ncbi:M16 family metallopeptidase [Dethiosulfatarculus sandiegensis]|uniref:Peptidase M16 n=1 Tax=Dethiosulfatarculus sandiegensis TaxID=1429043 RepID=A0A0D2JD00_9BACT|nr:pitrilysin family protein [Dethiosulfatarculus sandiegensis]KIX16054.1 hypothetical protein X474_00760 [Dethiosulfatarculus sandiegensis]